MLTLRVGYRLALTGCLLAGSVVCGQAPPRVEPASLCPPCLHDEVLKGLPVDIEAVIAVNGGARQRASAAGKALTGMIQSSPAMAETVQAWQQLSATLGWTPERTFDEVLGRRVSLVVRGVSDQDGNGGPDWALMSEVSTDTQRHLRSRLKAAPRGAIAGMSVLSIEEGSFEFVVSPEATKEGGRGAIILLAPRRSESMLDALAPSLSVIPAAAGASSRKACDVVLVWQTKAGPDGASAQSMTITASVMDSGWDASIVCSPNLVLNPDGPPPRRWSDSTFKALESGSLLAAMSCTGSMQPIQPLAFIPASVRSWVDELSAVVGSGASGLRVAAFVRAGGPTPVRPATGVAGTRTVGAKDSAALHGRLSVTVAAETADPRQALVQGDRAIARFARVLMAGRSDIGDGLPGVQLEIADPGPRSLQLGEAFAVHPDLEPSMTRAFGETPMLAWTTLTSPRLRAPGEGAGWWVASLSSTGAGDREFRALLAPETGQAMPRLCVGIVRPAALDRWVSAVEPEVLGTLSGAAFIDSFRWDFWVREDGQVEGSVNLRMAAPQVEAAIPPARK